MISGQYFPFKSFELAKDPQPIKEEINQAMNAECHLTDIFLKNPVIDKKVIYNFKNLKDLLKSELDVFVRSDPTIAFELAGIDKPKYQQYPPKKRNQKLASKLLKKQNSLDLLLPTFEKSLKDT
jgi:hypothetical protein